MEQFPKVIPFVGSVPAKRGEEQQLFWVEGM